MKKHPPARQVVISEKRIGGWIRIRVGAQTGPIEEPAPPPSPPTPQTKKLSPAEERAIRKLVREKLMQPRIVGASPHGMRAVPRTRLVAEALPTHTRRSAKTALAQKKTRSKVLLKKKPFVPSEELIKAYSALSLQDAKQPPGPPKTMTREEERASGKARQQRSREQDRDVRKELQASLEAARNSAPQRKAQYQEQNRVLEQAATSADPHLKKAAIKEQKRLKREYRDVQA